MTNKHAKSPPLNNLPINAGFSKTVGHKAASSRQPSKETKGASKTFLSAWGAYNQNFKNIN